MTNILSHPGHIAKHAADVTEHAIGGDVCTAKSAADIAGGPAGDPLKWYAQWLRAYERARAYRLAEVEGVLASKDFLNAVGARIAPSWASRALQDLIRDDELGDTPLTLEKHGKWFEAIGHQEASGAKGPAMFTTLNEAPQGQLRAPQSNRDRTRFHCPCKENEQATHTWTPEKCVILEQATKGSSPHAHKLGYDALTPSQATDIRKRLQLDKWTDLRARLSDMGWMKEKQANKQNKRGKKEKEQQQASYPGGFSAFFQEKHASEPPGIFSLAQDLPHQLSESTLLDNCGASHLVNTRDLLEPGSFRAAAQGDFVEAGTTSFPITGRGTRVLRNVLATEKGPKTADLTLLDVVVVEGFHVNITVAVQARIPVHEGPCTESQKWVR